MAARVHQTSLVPFVIPSGSFTHTLAIDLREKLPVALIMSAAWTSAAISFSGSAISSDPLSPTFGWLARGSKVIRINPAIASARHDLPKNWFRGVNFLFVVSGDLSLGVGGLVNQTADRTLYLECEDRDPVVIIGG